MRPFSRRCHRKTGHLSVVSGLGVCLLQCVLLVSGCRVPNRHVTSTRPPGCAECHVAIASQWRASAHAAAWTSSTFQESVDGGARSACLPCHAPEPLLEQTLSEPPTLRDAHREDGVDCHACHAFHGAYAGRRETFGPHPMEQDLTRLPCAEFCGRCHQQEMKEYDESYAATVPPAALATCADCHMPRRAARLTQGHLLSLIHPTRDVRDHTFSVWTPAVTAGAVEIVDVRRGQSSADIWVVRATVLNRGAGHCVPTGKFGHREVRVLAEAVDERGQVLARDEQSLVAGSEEALFPGRPAEYVLRLRLSPGAQPRRLVVTVERVDEDRGFRYALATRDSPPP